MHIAARGDALIAALVLLEHGVSANDYCQTVGSPLSVALKRSNKDWRNISEALLSHGADPNEEDAQQMTPLQIVISNGHPDSLRVLLEWGADPNTTYATCDLGCSPLILAVRLSSLNSSLVGNDDAWKDSKDAKTLLADSGLGFRMASWAKISGYSSSVIEVLLAHDAEADASCERCGTTAMIEAIEAENWLAEDILQRYGATRDPFGQRYG